MSTTSLFILTVFPRGRKVGYVGTGSVPGNGGSTLLLRQIAGTANSGENANYGGGGRR